MRRLAINSGDAFILVYSVDSLESFEEVDRLRQSILEEREQSCSEQATNSSLASSNRSSCSALAANASHNAPVQNAKPQSYNPTTESRAQVQFTDELPVPVAKGESSPACHWSLASSLGIHLPHHNNHHQSPQSHSGQNSDLANGRNASLSSGSTSCSTSTDNSRRSSLSAAELALKTRRTRCPPMVIVANKHDLPDEQHLVNSDEIEALAVIDWNTGFVRASAALDLNIGEIFQQVMKQARQPPTLTEAIVSKRRKSLPPKWPQCEVR